MSMTLGEFAYVIDAEPKWVQNAASALGAPFPHTLPTARRLLIARAVSDETGMPLARAYRVAKEALHRYDGSVRPVRIAGDDGSVAVSIDVYRLLASLSAGMSRLAMLYAPKQRGRPRRPKDPVRTARAYGVDITLLDANLRRSPAERLRMLDAMVQFQRRVRRVGLGPAAPRKARRARAS
jgi:hypothetical protein